MVYGLVSAPIVISGAISDFIRRDSDTKIEQVSSMWGIFSRSSPDSYRRWVSPLFI